MYLRFQTKVPDPESGRPRGILVAAASLRDSNEISMEGEAWLRGHLDFYNTHLKVPSCLKEWKNRRALSWFKPTSKFIAYAWELAAFMEESDIFIDVIKTNSPGTVVYEDGNQIVAIPRRKKSR